MSEGLLERWRSLAGDGLDEVGMALIRAYSEPQRHYHDQSHLTWLLREQDRRAALIAGPAFVGYAIWFHDAVYVPGNPDNETRSADWSREALSFNPELASDVGRVIEMTKDHLEGHAEGDAALFLDMDLAILGTTPSQYRAYAAGVRAEYGAFPDAAFSAGRRAFLERLLARPRLFRTDVYQDECGAIARRNMRWEAELLESGRMVGA